MLEMSSLSCTEPVAHVSPDPQLPPGQSDTLVQGAPALLPPRHSIWLRSPFVSPPILVKTVGSPAGHRTQVSPDGQGCVESQNCWNVTLQRLTLSTDSGSTAKAAATMDGAACAAKVSTGAIGGSLALTNEPHVPMPAAVQQAAGTPAAVHPELSSKMPPVPVQWIGVVWVELVRQPEGFAAVLAQSKGGTVLALCPTFASSSTKLEGIGLHRLAHPTPSRESAERG